MRKLERDVVILAAMATDMDAYIVSDVLFWPMQQSGMPKLTLGGYLMRQHRLLALISTLNRGDQAQVETAVTCFNQALVEKIVRFEKKAHWELGARIRQWTEYLREVGGEGAPSRAFYATAVDARAMISALIEKMEMPPYQLDPQIPGRVDSIDKNLRQRWQPGKFVWPNSWQPAYPKTDYWWLYGQPV